MVVTIQIVGHKKSGKTLIMTQLIQALTQAGVSVTAVKHDAHWGQMDQPGTDSDRFSQAGASQVVLDSNQGSFYHFQQLQALETTFSRLSPTAVRLIEGYKAGPYPKLVMLKPDELATNWHQKGILAFASLTDRPDLDLIGTDQIVNWLLTYLQTHLQEEKKMSDPLTHFNDQDRAKMVDVTQKAVTSRVATATGQITMHPDTLSRIKTGKIKKGDVLAVAQVAGIMAAKKTSELIPMCHLIPLTGVDLHFSDNKKDTITVTSKVKTKHVTGVEIEALNAVQIALLTIYDMCKAMDRGMVIHDVHLLEKDGGKSGHFVFGE